MDSSVTRRGQPCWYKLPHVGHIAINDAFLLQAHMYKIIKAYFAKHPAYVQIMELFTEVRGSVGSESAATLRMPLLILPYLSPPAQVTWQTELGQLLDLTSQPTGSDGAVIVDLDRFTLERYRAIVKYKTAYYSFYLPVACGLILSGLATDKSLADAEAITCAMGEYFQVQDDYLDCYADPTVLGKIGTDIQDNKCSWLVVQALARASPDQIAVLKANYGRKDAAAEATVKALYVDLGLQAVFEAYEAESYTTLQSMIAATCADGSVPESVYLSLLAKIYKRSK